MIEFIEVMFRALTGLKLTFPTLISLAAFFAAGYYFAAMTKRLGPIKVVVVLFLAYILSTVLSGLLGVYTLAVVVGFFSNQGVFLARMLFWAESLAEILFVMRHRMAFEDIRQEEGSRHRTREGSPHPPPSGSQPKKNEQDKQHSRSGSGGKTDPNSKTDWTPGRSKNQADIDQGLRILELETGKTYTQKEIKKAYRRLAMIHHPDLPTGSHAAFVTLGMALDYLMKHMAS
jgi:hypothetical protein